MALIDLEVLLLLPLPPQMLELTLPVTIPSILDAGDSMQSFRNGRQALYRLIYIPSSWLLYSIQLRVVTEFTVLHHQSLDHFSSCIPSYSPLPRPSSFSNLHSVFINLAFLRTSCGCNHIIFFSVLLAYFT